MELEEGVACYKDAIAFLKKVKAASPLKWDECLLRACKDHYKDIAVKGLTSHIGSDKSTYKDRIERYCRWGGSIFEAMDFAPRTDP